MSTSTAQQIRNPLFATCTTPAITASTEFHPASQVVGDMAVNLPKPAPITATGFLRIKQIIGDPKAKPPRPPIIPVSRSGWWAGVKSGRYPKPLKLSPRVTVWRCEDIIALIVDPDGRK